MECSKWNPFNGEKITCKTCREDKVYDFFAKKGKQKPYICKLCFNKKANIIRASNPEKYNKKAREIYEYNKDAINKKRRENLQLRRNTDPCYRVMMALHCRLYMAVKKRLVKQWNLPAVLKTNYLNI